MSEDVIQRSVLPIPSRKRVGLTTYDAKDAETTFAPIEPLRPPAGAPNVLIVLLDDVGFGSLERVRRTVQHADRGAAGRGGLKYNRFHTTALVRADAGRAADGRNHHTVGMGVDHRISPPRRPVTARCGPMTARRWRRRCG